MPGTTAPHIKLQGVGRLLSGKTNCSKFFWAFHPKNGLIHQITSQLAQLNKPSRRLQWQMNLPRARAGAQIWGVRTQSPRVLLVLGWYDYQLQRGKAFMSILESAGHSVQWLRWK